jgi:hypothetical protein
MYRVRTARCGALDGRGARARTLDLQEDAIMQDTQQQEQHVAVGTSVVADSHEPVVVSTADLREVRRALARGPRRNADVAVPLRVVCERAHHAGIRAEQLLVQVKRAWRELPEVRRVESLATRDEELDDLVSALIEQFYLMPDKRTA